MSTPNTETCNLALGHLGVSQTISDVNTERSPSALVCRRFWDMAFKEALRDFPWSFANKIAALGLIEEDPNEEWSFSYQYPPDCMSALKIQSGIRNDSRDTRVPYKISTGDSGLVIYTDKEDAILEYTKEITNYGILPQDFQAALSLLLAFYIAPSVTGGDPFQLGTRAYKAYLLSIAKAQVNSYNEQQEEEQPESEFIRSRE
ncbi:MAG: hypothetical protein A4E53_01665 [Pelotomaculum sp. PtaB.Bin104]|jgi:hypothetical protein|nr:MAG: hypothetical protein A4E53_01665 [Pelotomaculum sp. PtaB.Bin104]